MKKQINPAIAVVAVLVVLAVAAVIYYRGLAGGQEGRSSDMSPELRAKIIGGYGGGAKPGDGAAPTSGRQPGR